MRRCWSSRPTRRLAISAPRRAGVAGAGAFYALPENGLSFGADTVTYNHPILAMIFGETGIMAGAAIEGTKYTRIIPSALGHPLKRRPK